VPDARAAVTASPSGSGAVRTEAEVRDMDI
jgi:hypothetical protein